MTPEFEKESESASRSEGKRFSIPEPIKNHIGNTVADYSANID
jgi:hypothetical protein